MKEIRTVEDHDLSYYYIDDPDEELKILIRNHILNTINEVKIQLNIV